MDKILGKPEWRNSSSSSKGQEDGQNEEDLQEQAQNTSALLSPRESVISSKTIKLKGKSYQVRKQRINNLDKNLKANSSIYHLEHLDK